MGGARELDQEGRAMSRSRISEGFHRVGLVVAVPCVFLGLQAFVGGDRKVMLWWAAIGLGLYAVSRALGWIADGFFGGPKQ